MAVRNPTITQLYDGALVVQWSGLLNGDIGAPVEYPGHSDRSVQIQGTFGVGGTCVIQGSNDGTNYQSLTDPQGNAISKTAASIEMVTELTRYIRPNITAGDGTTNLEVTMVLRRSQRP